MKPKELRLYEQIQYWHTLPRTGGILDQPYGLLDRLEQVAKVYQSIIAYNRNWETPGWQESHEELMRTLMRYWDIRDEAENA